MENTQYRRQHYITYHGYKYSLPSVARFIRHSGDYYLFPPPERKYPACKAAKGLSELVEYNYFIGIVNVFIISKLSIEGEVHIQQ